MAECCCSVPQCCVRTARAVIIIRESAEECDVDSQLTNVLQTICEASTSTDVDDSVFLRPYAVYQVF
jgi:hypothetical protein